MNKLTNYNENLNNKDAIIIDNKDKTKLSNIVKNNDEI
jgi:hypothetical protein